jgi:hypothetical protein
MPLQDKVRTTVAEGLPGLLASQHNRAYAGNRTAGPGVAAGRFVFAPPAAEADRLRVYGSAATVAAAVPVGIVQRSQIYPDLDLLSPGTLEIPQGEAVDVLVEGDVWVEVASGPLTEGSLVFARAADGAVVTGADAAAPPALTVPTTWRVVWAGADGLAVIANPGVSGLVFPPYVE